MRTFWILAALILWTPLEGAAQDRPALEPGTWVRVTIPSQSVRKAQVMFNGVRGDTVALSGMTTHLANVTRLEVFAGRKSHWILGAAVGGVSGGLLAALSGAMVNTLVCDVTLPGANCSDSSPPYVPFIVGGALIGAGVGALIKTDRWVPVPLERLRVGAAPRRNGGFGLGVSLSF